MDGVHSWNNDLMLCYFLLAGLQEVPPSVRPGSCGAIDSGDGYKGGHHAAREGPGHSSAGHSGGSRTGLCQPGNLTNVPQG